MIIRQGAIFAYSGQWPQSLVCAVAGFCDTPSQIIAKVSTALTGDSIPVLNYSLPFFSGTFSESFTVTLQLMNQSGLDQSDQGIVSIIRHEVFVVTGHFPFSDSIPLIQNPQSVAIATGQPGLSPPDQPSSTFSGLFSGLTTGLSGSNGISAATSSFSDVLKQLASNTRLVVVGLALGLITAVLLIARPRNA